MAEYALPHDLIGERLGGLSSCRRCSIRWSALLSSALASSPDGAALNLARATARSRGSWPGSSAVWPRRRERHRCPLHGRPHRRRPRSAPPRCHARCDRNRRLRLGRRARPASSPPVPQDRVRADGRGGQAGRRTSFHRARHAALHGRRAPIDAGVLAGLAQMVRAIGDRLLGRPENPRLARFARMEGVAGEGCTMYFNGGSDWATYWSQHHAGTGAVAREFGRDDRGNARRISTPATRTRIIGRVSSRSRRHGGESQPSVAASNELRIQDTSRPLHTCLQAREKRAIQTGCCGGSWIPAFRRNDRETH